MSSTTSATARDIILSSLHKKFDTDPATVTDDSVLDDIGADSIFLVEVAIDLEHALDISVPEGILTSEQTLGQALAALDSLDGSR